MGILPLILFQLLQRCYHPTTRCCLWSLAHFARSILTCRTNRSSVFFSFEEICPGTRPSSLLQGLFQGGTASKTLHAKSILSQVLVTSSLTDKLNPFAKENV